MYHIVPQINTHHNIVIWYQMCYIFIHYFIGYKLPNPTPQAWWDPMDPTKPKALGPGAELDDTLSVSWRGWMSMPSMSLSSQVLKSKKSQWWCSGMFGLSLLKFTEMQEHHKISQPHIIIYYIISYSRHFSSDLITVLRATKGGSIIGGSPWPRIKRGDISCHRLRGHCRLMFPMFPHL